MILYFANRKFDIIGQASTEMREGFIVFDDLKTEEIETGVASFECYIAFDKSNRLLLNDMTQAGNYLLRKNDDENEFYTIIDTETDTKERKIYIYAEDAGLDLLNEEAPEYEATESHTAEWYINKYITDSGFEIGINEIPDDRKRKISWANSSNVTERIASIANEFGGFEVSYSFDVVGMEVTHKYINLYEERGKDVGEQLRLNRELDRIVIKQSIANIATALRVEGGTPENSSSPITLKGYKYDDGDFWVGSNGTLYSREAVEVWSRYNWEKKNPGWEGHIIKSFSYDTTSQSTLLSKAIAHLKKVREVEVNYEVDINELPDNIKIGDRVNVVDDAGELYLSTRLLVLERSVANDTQKATLGEYLIKGSGISEKVMELAEQFADIAANRQFYTWTAYADDDNGAGISLDPTDKEYLGTAVNQTSEQVDISVPSIFTWIKVKGDQGIQGPKGDKGDTGDTGAKGDNGEDGKGISDITDYYLVSTLTNGITINTSGWSLTPQSMTDTDRYLWHYQVITYTDNSTKTVLPTIIGVYGDTGATGKGINSVTPQYYLSSSDAEQTEGSWKATQDTWSNGKYYWIRDKIVWNDDSTTYTIPVLATGLNNANSVADSAKSTADQAQEDTNALEERVEATEKSIIENADNIELRVKKGDIISSINQSAEEIQIKAEKIKLEGLVTANNNFKILEDGSIETVNGKFSGMINAESGTIAGWMIKDNAFESVVETDNTKSLARIDSSENTILFSCDVTNNIVEGEIGSYSTTYSWQGISIEYEYDAHTHKTMYASPSLIILHDQVNIDDDRGVSISSKEILLERTYLGESYLSGIYAGDGDYLGNMYIYTTNYLRIGGGGDTTANKLYLYSDRANFNGTDFRISNTRLPYKTTSATVKIGAHSANGIDSKTVTVSNAVEIAGWNANGTGSSGIVLNRISCSGSSLYLEFRCIIATDATTSVVVYYRNY